MVSSYIAVQNSLCLQFIRFLDGGLTAFALLVQSVTFHTDLGDLKVELFCDQVLG